MGTSIEVRVHERRMPELRDALRPANVADLLLDYLEAEGVTAVFSVPGGPIMEQLAALARKRTMRTVLCKSEAGAVAAADGYARASGRIGVAIVTSGPGATNALTGMATAWADRVPILVLSGQVATTVFGRGAAQDSSVFGVDVVAMAKPVTALSCMIASAAQAVSLIPQACRMAWCERRPVHLQIPADVLAQELGRHPQQLGTYRIGRYAPHDAAALKTAAALLARARRPAILLGNGVRPDRSDAWMRVAERLGAAVVTSPKAKGVFPEDHPLSLGVFGFAGSPQAEQALLHSDVDVLLVVGCALGELSTHNWSQRLRPATLIQVDHDAARISASYPALGVVGDAGAVAAALLAELAQLPANGSAEHGAWVRNLKLHVARVLDEQAMASDAIPLRPERVFAEIQACLPEQAVVFCDIGNSMAYGLHYLSLRSQQRFLVNLGFACMGHAVGAAIGARFAAPDLPVICIVGDAAFAMSGFEVHTPSEYPLEAARYGGPVFLVMSNGGNGMVEAGGLAQYGAHSGIDFGVYRNPFDVSQIARGLGAAAVVVERPGELAHAIEAALQAGRGPTVIDVRVARGMPPMGKRIENLIAYAAGEGRQP